MLPLLRILFGVALTYELIQGARSAPGAGETGDMTGAFYMVVCVGLGILNAIVWAPYLGEKVSGPLMGVMTRGEYVERKNWVLWLIRRLDARGSRRVVAWLCFLEGVRHPASPAPFSIGMRNAKVGSWLEKIYAREVFRFHNTQNCVEAYRILKRHGINLPPHQNQEVNALLLSLERPPRPEPQVISVPEPAPPPALKRNRRIRLSGEA